MERTNYYLEEFDQLFEDDVSVSYKQQQWLGRRGDLVETYGWAIPTDEAIEYLADQGRVLSIGAGNGYWEWLLRGEIQDVVAFDIDPPDETWTNVEQGTEQMIERFNDDWTLFLCWPPYDTSMAYNAVQKHIEQGGTDVIYVGEFNGCTADEDFHDLLATRYANMETIDIPSYEGVRDNMYHFKRKI